LGSDRLGFILLFCCFFGTFTASILGIFATGISKL
jgi:hypothetical protein